MYKFSKNKWIHIISRKVEWFSSAGRLQESDASKRPVMQSLRGPHAEESAPEETSKWVPLYSLSESGSFWGQVNAAMTAQGWSFQQMKESQATWP